MSTRAQQAVVLGLLLGLGAACTERLVVEVYDLDDPDDLLRMCEDLCEIQNCDPKYGYTVPEYCVEACVDDPRDWAGRPQYCRDATADLNVCMASLTCEEYGAFYYRVGEYPCFEERLAIEAIDEECFKSGQEHPNNPNYEGD